MSNIEIFGVPYLKKRNIIKCLEGTPEGGLLNKEDSTRLLKLKSRFVGDKPDEYFWRSFKFEKDTSDVADFFKSYMSSVGFERILKNQDTWWKSRHPYRKWYSNSDLGTRDWFELAKRINPNLYTTNMYAELSASYTVPNEAQRINVVGTRKSPSFGDDYEFNFIEATGHEYAHGVAPFNIFGATPFSSKSAQAEALDLNTNTKPGHDSWRDEKHADLWGLRYLLYKEGIYDSRSDKDITEEEILKLREKYPNLRALRLMDNKLVMFLLNNVASTNDNIVRAKTGIKIKKKNRGKFTEYCGGEVTNKCILKAKKSSNSKLVKRAVFAQNARKWKHKEGGEINNKDLNKDEKPKKKLAIKRLTNSTGIVNKRPIPGLLTNELVALNTKKNETKK